MFMDLDEKDRYTSTWNLFKGSWHSFDELGVKHTLRKHEDANVWVNTSKAYIYIYILKN